MSRFFRRRRRGPEWTLLTPAASAWRAWDQLPKRLHDPIAGRHVVFREPMGRGDDGSDITSFYHCSRCLDEWSRLGPEAAEHIAPRDYARLSVGRTDSGAFQIWCSRHDMEVLTFPPVGDLPTHQHFPEDPQ